MAWFSSAHSRKMAEKQGRGQVNTSNIFCLFWIWSPVSFFLVGIPHVYASILFLCITVHLVFVYSNRSALAFSSGLDFGMPPLSFSLNRDVLGSNLSSGLLWTHGNIIISKNSLDCLVNSVTAHYSVISPTTFYLKRSLFMSPVSQLFWELGSRDSNSKRMKIQALV